MVLILHNLFGLREHSSSDDSLFFVIFLQGWPKLKLNKYNSKELQPSLKMCPIALLDVIGVVLLNVNRRQ
jgi:hypothetical protein